MDLSSHTWKLRLWHFDHVPKFTWLEHRGQKDSTAADMTPKCPHKKSQLMELKNTYKSGPPTFPLPHTYFPCPIHSLLTVFWEGEKNYVPRKMFPSAFSLWFWNSNLWCPRRLLSAGCWPCEGWQIVCLWTISQQCQMTVPLSDMIIIVGAGPSR